MFRRVLLENWVAIFPLAAFVTALVVYFSISYKALRMRPSQVDQLSRLPFNDQPSAPHDHAAES